MIKARFLDLQPEIAHPIFSNFVPGISNFKFQMRILLLTWRRERNNIVLAWPGCMKLSSFMILMHQFHHLVLMQFKYQEVLKFMPTRSHENLELELP